MRLLRVLPSILRAPLEHAQAHSRDYDSVQKTT